VISLGLLLLLARRLQIVYWRSVFTIRVRLETIRVLMAGKLAVYISYARYEMLADMQTKRWYPSVVTIASGEAIIVSGSLQNLNFENLDNTNNPTYEYYPARNALPPKVLPSLDKMFPFNLYPAVYQLAHGPVMIFTANTTDLLDTASDSLLPAKIPDILMKDKMPWIYPYTPTSVMLPLTKENGYTSSIMVCGGTRTKDLKADERCIGIDFASESPEWRELTSDPMPSIY
jgi:Glyoxal oxidase N-terminus